MTDTQAAVADADRGEAQPSPDATHEPSWQDMLKQYEEQSPAKTQKQPQKAEERVAPPSTNGQSTEAADDDEVRQWVRDQRAKQETEDFQKGISDAVSFLKEADEALADIPDKIAIGILHGEAADNPAFAQAFAMRHRAPHLLQQALKEVANSVAKDLSSKPDPKLTADREAARASVRGTSQTRPDQSDDQKEFEKRISDMSPADFAKWRMTHG